MISPGFVNEFNGSSPRLKLHEVSANYSSCMIQCFSCWALWMFFPDFLFSGILTRLWPRDVWLYIVCPFLNMFEMVPVMWLEEAWPLYNVCVCVCVCVLRGAVLISLLERKPGSQIHPLCLQENICSSFVPSLLVFIPSSGTHSQSVCSSPSVLFLSNQKFCQIMLSTFMYLFI